MYLVKLLMFTGHRIFAPIPSLFPLFIVFLAIIAKCSRGRLTALHKKQKGEIR